MTFELDFFLVGLMFIFTFFVQGTTGFGSIVLAAPVTTGLLGTAVGVPLGTVLSLTFMVVLGVQVIKKVSWKDLIKIVILCAPGLFFGQYLFLRISPEVAKVSIGAMVMLIALINVYNHIIKPVVLKKEVVNDAPDTLVKKVFRYGCLLLGGVVHGAFNIGGPLITVYTLYAVEDKEKFRNTMTWVWLILNTMNSISQYSNNLWSMRMWNAYLIAMPMAAIGFFFGVKFLNKINKQQFLRFIYIVLLFVGTDMFVRNLLVLIG